jgi:hypothetical protein
MSNKLSQLDRRSVQLALGEFVRLGRDAFLQKYGFGPAREYFVVDPESGLPCDSKAVAGAAFGFGHPEVGPLRPKQFSGGEVTVVKALRGLGFQVVRGSEETDNQVDRDWTSSENELIVADYLEMLIRELAGQTFNKAERARALMPLLRQRSKGAIEFKRANISAALMELGYPPLNGYKPRGNFQRDALLEVISRQLPSHPLLDKLAEAAVERPAVVPDIDDFARVRVEAPARRVHVGEERAPYKRVPTRRDFLELEARNRSLGTAGEEFVVGYERWRLVSEGAPRLADKVAHVSQTQGDGLGYDVLSFDVDGKERFIEVKTTAHDAATPFYITANEVEFARERPESFQLYRLYRFRTEPRFFALHGAIEQHCHLDPATFRATR